MNYEHNGRQSNAPADQTVLVDTLAKALTDALQEKKYHAEPQVEVKSIDLVELACHILSKFHYVLVCALIGAVIMVMQAMSSVPIYSATAKLYIVGSQGASINVTDLQLGAMLTMDYEEVFRTWEVHEMVRSQLGVNYTYSQLQSMISVVNPEDTRILYITARHSNAQMAADIANAYASAARSFILQTMDTEEPNLFSMALVPSVASIVSKKSNAAKGFLLGAVIAVGVITLLFVLDDRPRSPEHIQQAAGIPTLAVIPAAEKPKAKPKAQKRGQKREIS